MVRFGVGVPTGAEGLMYPVPFAEPEEAVGISVLAERLGYDSVWANDHVSTPAYVRAAFADPPRFFEPYTYLAYVAASTTSIGLATAITVMSFRHPALLIKQVTTLDQLSGGRFTLGLGIGAYRAESEVVNGPGLHRGRHAEDFLRAFTSLMRHRRASYTGRLFSFHDVESWPKGVHERIPVLSGGNAVGSRERAARYCDGWLPAGLLPAEIHAGLTHIREVAEREHRELPLGFEVAPQFTVRLGRTTQEAQAAFERTQLRAHDVSLAHSTMKDQAASDWRLRDLIGSPEEVVDRIHNYLEAGVTTFAGLLFADDDVRGVQEQMEWFADEVMTRARGGDHGRAH